MHAVASRGQAADSRVPASSKSNRHPGGGLAGLPAFQRKGVRMNNPFGALKPDVKENKKLCVPSAKEIDDELEVPWGASDLDSPCGARNLSGGRAPFFSLC